MDESTAGLSEYDAYLLFDLLQQLAAERAVLAVVRNEREARLINGNDYMARVVCHIDGECFACLSNADGRSDHPFNQTDAALTFNLAKRHFGMG